MSGNYAAGVIIGVIGFALLWGANDLTIAVGVLLMIWGNNLERKQ